MSTVKIATGALAAWLMAQAAHAGEVRVTLTGVEARGGQILAQLQTEGQFLGAEAAHRAGQPAPSQPGSVTFVFPDVAPGVYAFTAMHDANGDYKMQTLPSGMPAEGWAMSNGRALQGPATFAVVRFEVGAAPVTITEPIVYPPPAQ
jgi:uncharacterized protein (DUF2141 family)